MRFPQSSQIRVAALALLAVPAGIIVILLVAAYSSATGSPVASSIYLGALALVISGMVANLLLLHRLRCAECGQRVAGQKTFTDPPYAEPIFGLIGSNSVLLRALLFAKFQCMHCGQRYEL